jgi:RimJ/RimL family protein N-acetyltransferase
MITLRDLQERDLAFLVDVRNECRNFLHNASEFSLEECETWFRKTSPTFYVIENNGNIVGYFRTSEWKESSCWVGGDLHKDYRGKGMMKSAYSVLFERLKEKGIETVFLSVLDFNEVAINLYEKLGFRTLSIDEFCQGSTNKIAKSIQMVKNL